METRIDLKKLRNWSLVDNKLKFLTVLIDSDSGRELMENLALSTGGKFINFKIKDFKTLENAWLSLSKGFSSFIELKYNEY